MSRLEAILTRIPNRPGELHRLTTAVTEANVNIKALYVNAHGSQGIVCLVCDRPQAAAQAITATGAELQVRTVFAKRLADRPGELARFTQLLAREGVNIRQVIGSTTPGARDGQLYFEVDDPVKGARFFE